MDTYSFDLQRIFFGEMPTTFLLEIVFRSTILFIFTMIGLRLIGQRGVRQLSPFELGMIIALGSAVGDPMFYPNVPLIHGMIAITVVLCIHRGVIALTNHNRRIEVAVEGKVHRVVIDGQIDNKGMNASQLSVEEVFLMLRHEGITHLSQVHRAYLETNGMVSVIRGADNMSSDASCILPDHEDYEAVLQKYEQNMLSIKES